MARKKTENPDVAEAADALATAEQNTRTPRFPVSPAVLAELAKYGDKTGRTQVQVAEALEADILALLKGELYVAVSQDASGEPVLRPVPSLKARGIAEMEENW